MEAWYFSEDSKKLRFDDGRDIAVGVTHTVAGPIEMCERGLHASVRALDALNHAPGPVVWRVRLGGEILAGYDKCCATERTYISGADATEVLRSFARRCARDVIHLWDAPDVVRQYLETGDESLRDAAWDAAASAWTAARNAAWAAVGAAAAAWNAAGDAAWNAAWAAVGAAAAAWNAAGAAARAKYNGWLEEMLAELLEAS